MKVIILISIFCLLGASCAAPSASGLDEDFQDFVKLMPLIEMRNVAWDYLAHDKQVKAAIQYLQGEEFVVVWNEITRNKDFQNLVTYLDNAGLHVVDGLNWIAHTLNLPKYPPQTYEYSENFRTGGLNGLLDDIVAILPKAELKALFHKKLQTSEAFKTLYNKLTSEDFRKLVNLAKSSPEVTNAIDLLNKNGVDVKKVGNFIKSVLGWN